MMFGYDTRLSMPWKDYFRRSDDFRRSDEEVEKAEELDTIRGKLANNRDWMADNANCHSSECDRERAFHEDRISSLEHRLDDIRREKERRDETDDEYQ